jgi:hypothetical protein
MYNHTVYVVGIHHFICSVKRTVQVVGGPCYGTFLSVSQRKIFLGAFIIIKIPSIDITLFIRLYLTVSIQ